MCYGSPRSSINLSVLEDSFLAEDTTGGFPAEGPVADCFRRRGKQDASDSVEHHCSSSPVLGYLPCIPEEELASERREAEEMCIPTYPVPSNLFGEGDPRSARHSAHETSFCQDSRAPSLAESLRPYQASAAHQPPHRLARSQRATSLRRSCSAEPVL